MTPICREAWLDPRRFSLSTSCRAGLRRKLRRAEAAGVTITAVGDLPLPEMARIAAQWAAAHGGERGFSMGRFTPAYVARQRVYLARQRGRLIAFATFHRGAGDWALDLMRHVPDLPDGTMQALITAAILDAGHSGLSRLSLAAVPEAAFGKRRMVDRVLQAFGCDGKGLLQFKAGFAPKWRKLYLAAPNRAGVMLAATEIARAVAPSAALATRSAGIWICLCIRAVAETGKPPRLTKRFPWLTTRFPGCFPPATG